MIKVTRFRANEDVIKGKNGSFTKGNTYLGRVSNSSDMYLLLSNEGDWIPMITYEMTRRSIKDFKDQFTEVDVMYFENKKQLDWYVSR